MTASSQVQHYFLKLCFSPERLIPLQLLKDAGEGCSRASLFQFGFDRRGVLLLRHFGFILRFRVLLLLYAR